LVYKPLTPEDVGEEYVAWLNDPEINRFLETRFVDQSLETCRDFVGRMNADPLQHLFGMFDKECNRHIGNIKLGPINRRHLLADIGLIIGRREFWGKGIATEAISLLRDYAFSEIGLHKLTAGCYSTNLGSAKAFEKAGFALEGRRPKHSKAGNEWVDLLEFGCVNSTAPIE